MDKFIVDVCSAEEEPLTFHISLSVLSKLYDSREGVLTKVREDLFRIGREWASRSFRPPSIDNLRGEVRIRVIPHNKQFEGRTSGADFGLVLTVPEASKISNTFRVQGRSSGCIVQAKRIIATGIRYEPIRFGKGFSRLRAHRAFASFVLYRFKRDNEGKPYDSKISFCSVQRFKNFNEAAVKKSLTAYTQHSVRKVDARKMVEGLLSKGGDFRD